ncbi:hypothetical protein JCM16303_002629 [Sporobolomyces ruberrimus]
MNRLLDMVPSRDHLAPLGAAGGLLPPTLFLVLLLSPPSRFLNLSVLPLFCLYSIYSCVFYTSGSATDDYGRASLQFTLVLRAIDAFLLSQPSFELAFKRSKRNPVPRPWTWKRLGWAIKFATTLRGAGWEWQVVPKTSQPSSAGTKTSRWRFIQRRLGKFVVLYLGLDCISTYMQSRPYFHRTASFATLSAGERLLNVLAAGASAGLAINTLYQIVCILCVASQAWDPEECIDLFGSFRHAKNLRGFWGKTWHQSFRRPFSSIPAFFVNTVLRLSPTSPISAFTSAFFAFFLSALLHAFSAFVMNRTGTGSLKFFSIQPFGILLELVVGHLSRKSFPDLSKRVTMVVGFAWTATWLVYWAPYFIDELVQAGFWELDAAPVSLVRGLWKGEWLHV